MLLAGELVAFPTDTVYGVGAHGLRVQAVERLYRAKARPASKPIALLLARADDVQAVARDIPDAAWLLARRFWPGGLTLVVPKREVVPAVVTAGGPSVAVRMPDHPVTQALIVALGAPLAATSANLSGHPDAVTADEVLCELGDRVALILDGGRCPGGVPSTVVDLTVSPPAILRRGAIPEQDIWAVLSTPVHCQTKE
jgi:L-threonylcarbamoyladenylate synthase